MNTQELWSAREVGKSCISDWFLNTLMCKTFLHDTGFEGIKWVWREVKVWQYMIRLKAQNIGSNDIVEVIALVIVEATGLEVSMEDYQA